MMNMNVMLVSENNRRSSNNNINNNNNNRISEGGMDVLLSFSGSNTTSHTNNNFHNPTSINNNMNTSNVTFSPSLMKAATCTLQQHFCIPTSNNNSMMFTTVSSSVRKKAGVGMTRYPNRNHTNNNRCSSTSMSRTDSNFYSDNTSMTNQYSYNSGLSQLSLLECLTIATPTAIPTPTTMTPTKRCPPHLESSTTTKKRKSTPPKSTGATTNTSTSILEAIGTPAVASTTTTATTTTTTTTRTPEKNNNDHNISSTIINSQPIVLNSTRTSPSAVSGSILESIGLTTTATANTTTAPNLVQDQQRSPSSSWKNQARDILTQLVIPQEQQQQQKEVDAVSLPAPNATQKLSPGHNSNDNNNSQQELLALEVEPHSDKAIMMISENDGNTIIAQSHSNTVVINNTDSSNSTPLQLQEDYLINDNKGTDYTFIEKQYTPHQLQDEEDLINDNKHTDDTFIEKQSIDFICAITTTNDDNKNRQPLLPEQQTNDNGMKTVELPNNDFRVVPQDQQQPQQLISSAIAEELSDETINTVSLQQAVAFNPVTENKADSLNIIGNNPTAENNADESIFVKQSIPKLLQNSTATQLEQEEQHEETFNSFTLQHGVEFHSVNADKNDVENIICIHSTAENKADEKVSLEQSFPILPEETLNSFSLQNGVGLNLTNAKKVDDENVTMNSSTAENKADKSVFVEQSIPMLLQNSAQQAQHDETFNSFLLPQAVEFNSVNADKNDDENIICINSTAANEADENVFVDPSIPIPLQNSTDTQQQQQEQCGETFNSFSLHNEVELNLAHANKVDDENDTMISSRTENKGDENILVQQNIPILIQNSSQQQQKEFNIIGCNYIQFGFNHENLDTTAAGDEGLLEEKEKASLMNKKVLDGNHEYDEYEITPHVDATSAIHWESPSVIVQENENTQDAAKSETVHHDVIRDMSPDNSTNNDDGTKKDKISTSKRQQHPISRSEFTENLKRNVRESQNLKPYIVTDNGCHACRKRCPRVATFGCKFLSHGLCERHSEAILGVALQDLIAPSSKFNYCPICCFECPCSVCKGGLNKLRNEQYKTNRSCISHPFSNDSEHRETSKITSTSFEDVVSENVSSANAEPLDNFVASDKNLMAFSVEYSSVIIQEPEEEQFTTASQSESAAVQEYLLDHSDLPCDEIIRDYPSEKHPMSRTAFVEFMKRKRQDSITHPSISKDKNCHICHKRHPEVVFFGCEFSSHVFCKKHAESLLGLNLNLQELKSKYNYCPICCFECPCPSCTRRLDALLKEHNKSCQEQLILYPPVIADNQCSQILRNRKRKRSLLEVEKKTEVKESKNAFHSTNSAVRSESRIGLHEISVQCSRWKSHTKDKVLPKGVEVTSLDGITAKFFLEKDDFVEELRRVSRKNQKLKPFITHKEICHICHLRRPNLINFGCPSKNKHAFCEKHAMSRLGMENLSLQKIKSKLNHCPICCFECECAKCLRETNQLWTDQSKNQKNTAVDNIYEEENFFLTKRGRRTKAVRVMVGGKEQGVILVLFSAKDPNPESKNSGSFTYPTQTLSRYAYLMELKHWNQENRKVHPVVKANLSCHICRKRVSKGIIFGCSVTETHALCERHAKLRLGMENLNLQEMASKLNYCPICCFECECTKCVREFDSLWKEKIESMAPKITVGSSIGKNESLGAPINRCSDNSKEMSEFSRDSDEEKKEAMSRDITINRSSGTVEEHSEVNTPEKPINNSNEEMANDKEKSDSTTLEASIDFCSDNMEKNTEAMASQTPINHRGVSDEEKLEAISPETTINRKIDNVKIKTRISTLESTNDSISNRNEGKTRTRTQENAIICHRYNDEEYTKALTSEAPIGPSIVEYVEPFLLSPLANLGKCGEEWNSINDITRDNNEPYSFPNHMVSEENLKQYSSSSFFQSSALMERPKNIKECPFEGKSSVYWYCNRCLENHWVENRNALHPFGKKHGYWFEHVEADGDCFFTCIHRALRNDSEYLKQLNSYRRRVGMKEFMSFPSIAALRELVASSIGEEQLAFYQMQAIAHPNEPWLECFRISSRESKSKKIGGNDIKNKINGQRDEAKTSETVALGNDNQSTDKPNFMFREKRTCKSRQVTTIRTVDELKKFVLRLGSEYGAQYTFWADSFAQKVIADLLNITILFVDMERDRNCWPYRVLAKGVAHSFLDLPQDDGDAGATSNCDDIGYSKVVNDSFRYIVLQRQGHGHFTLLSYQEKAYGEKVRSFKADKLPPAVAALWGLK